MNAQIIDQFEKLIQDKKSQVSYHKSLGDAKEAKTADIKYKNFIKVLQIIKKYPTEIKTNADIEEFSKTKGIGKGTVKRIQEILEKGYLEEIKNDQDQILDMKPQLEKMEDLERVTGIGPSKAKKLYQEGITLETLLEEYKKYSEDNNLKNAPHLKSFTHHQLIGLKYFDKFEERIPHQEIKSLELLFQKYLIQFNSNLEATICGSYRRQEPTSGDIDILVTNKKDTILDNTILIKLIAFLHDKDFLLDDLTTAGTTKYMGVCIGSRRIDIRLIARESYPAGLLYFTGSKDFNTRVRSKALKEGMTLEEYGLYKLKKVEVVPKVKKNKKTETTEATKAEETVENKEESKKPTKIKYKTVKGDMIPVSSEKDILDKIGIEYLPPEKRKF